MKCMMLDARDTFKRPPPCRLEAKWDIHQLNDKHFYVCDKHYKILKRNGVLRELISKGRVTQI